jgi:hypothetical protein
MTPCTTGYFLTEALENDYGLRLEVLQPTATASFSDLASQSIADGEVRRTSHMLHVIMPPSCSISPQQMEVLHLFLSIRPP